jgi:DHA1 family bicyclomycin/chloramphenicol resistance-like MFS transporter
MVLWHGAFSDAWGRKPVIVVSMLLFALASLVCVFAGSIETLLVGRALQGISAGAGMVVGRAVVRDMHGRPRAQRLMSHVSMAFALGPAIAPILGGWIHTAFGWRAVFVFLALLGLALAALSAWRLAESHPVEARHPCTRPAGAALLGRVHLARLPAADLCGELQLQRLLLYVLSAPVFLIQHLGLPETGFGWFFIPTVSGMMAGSALSARLAGRAVPGPHHRAWAGPMMLAAGLNLAVTSLLPPGLPQSVLPIMLYTFGMAIAMPSLTLLALDHFPTHRGLASSCQSFLQMLVSSITAGLVAPALWGSVGSLAIGMLASTCRWAWAVSRAVVALFHRRRRRPGPA